MTTEIKALVEAKGIGRLCHFTPSRNLVHIAAGKSGVLCTAALEHSERATFNATDLKRLDGQKSHICCSIEYPNAWYFDRARSGNDLFPDWVVLLVDPKYLWQEGTLFCPRNAAAEYGRYIAKGPTAFEAMFANEVIGTGRNIYRRTKDQSAACPTDQQAEVLVPDKIAIADILGIAVKNEQQAKTERARLRATGSDPDMFRFILAPLMFNKYDLSNAIKNGAQLQETVFIPNSKTSGAL
ncbi:DarT ssDNA thymidine ADP-ribosyltransferase family protein [Bradyrhizobium sp.]|uniref:DarT ssDNA thymidine ADP-ribosyltransferase family protein n=1 Tax=Bradyrhizobium sp. TaxID=376 RepID=UPI0026060325|nr:DarT ssDNA thymidine ADP-ribosyltransferase family protein [Bradyrhizobium sp.]